MTPLQRLRPPGAARRLHELVVQRHDQPFAWGIRDCCLWAADAVHATTGRDFASDVRGSYWSARQAARVVQQHGGLAAMVTLRMGQPIEQGEAIDGDVCLLEPAAHERTLGMGALGVLWRGAVLAQADRGLAVHRLHVATCWWRAAP